MRRKGLSINDYFKLVLFMLGLMQAIVIVAVMIGFQVTIDEIYNSSSLGLGTFLSGIFLAILCFLFIYNFFINPIIITKKVVVEKVVEVEAFVKEDVRKEDETQLILKDIGEDFKNGFLKNNVKPEVAMLGSDAIDIYTLDDIVFRWETDPHFYLAGKSGGGKTQLLYNIIDKLNKECPNIRYLINDFGEVDFVDSVGNDLESFTYVLSLLEFIVAGRKLEKRNNREIQHTRIFWMIEEAESLFETLQVNYKKAKYEEYIVKIANFTRMARKLNISVCLIVQSGKAAQIDTKITNNLSNRFVMNTSNNISSRVYQLSYNTKIIPPGYAHYSNIEAFVKTKLMKEPSINAMSLKDLEFLSKSYKARFNLGDNQCDIDN